jgi:hypothetical protein
MRCRRVRFFLSAYCNNELTGSRQQTISEHLDSCPECRREEAVFREIMISAISLPTVKVSDDFNSRLLDRIAQERMAENKGKAYLPKNAPIFGWGRLVPAAATACLVLAFVLFGGLKVLDNTDAPVMRADISEGAGYGELDEKYRTALPIEQDELPPVIAQHEKVNWAFDKQLARATRIRNIMNQLASSEYFNNGYTRNYGNQIIPASGSVNRQLPIFYYPTAKNTQPVHIGNTVEVR